MHRLNFNAMPVEVYSHANLATADADPTTSAPAATRLVAPLGGRHPAVYWTTSGAAAGRTIDVELWALFGTEYVQVARTTGIAPNTLIVFTSVEAVQLFPRVAGVAGGPHPDFSLNALTVS